MDNTRLVRLYVTLSKKEMRDLTAEWEVKQNAVRTKRNISVYRLFEYLKNNHDKPKKLTKEKVFEYVYPGEAYKDKTLTYLRSAALNILENYIVQLQLKGEDSLQRDILLINYLKRKLAESSVTGDPDEKLSIWYATEIKNLFKKINKQQNRSVFSYLDVYRLSHLLYYNNDTNKFVSGELNFATLMDSLDKFICLAKLKYGSEAIARKRILNEETVIRMIESVLAAVDTMDVQGNLLLNIYSKYHRLISAKEYNETLFLELRDMVFEHREAINTSAMSEILFLLINYGAWAVRFKHPTNPINLSIYKFGFEHGIFIDEGFFPPHLLINYCYLSSETERGYEIPVILNKHLRKVKSDYSRPVQMLCLAYRDFSEGKYEDVYVNLLMNEKRIYPTFFHYNSLKIKCLYKIGEYIDPADGKYHTASHEADLFKKKVADRPFSDIVKQGNFNFADFIIKLNNAEYKNRTEAKADLGQYETIVYYDWLVKMVEGYK